MENLIKRILLKLIKLFSGFFVMALGTVMTVNADLGLSPWDVLNQGLSNVLGITLGQASISVGAIIIILDIIFGERIGWGTILNMIFFGTFIDLLMLNNLVPTFEGLLPRIIMIVLGLFVMGFGTYLYISAELASGPRDGLMIALVKRTKKSVRLIKNSQEIVAVIIGFLLGGKVGVGTVIMSFLGGYLMQFDFKLLKFDIDEVNHRFIDEDIKYIRNRLAAKTKLGK